MSTKSRVVHRTPYLHIVKIDGVCGGQAVIEGTRIAVWHIVGYYYKVGMSVEDILAEWNYLKPAQVFSALAYYHDNKQEIDEVREQNSYEHWKEPHAHAPASHYSTSPPNPLSRPLKSHGQERGRRACITPLSRLCTLSGAKRSRKANRERGPGVR